MGNSYRARSRWYSADEVATKSSTSGNGWRETIYTPWRGRSFEDEEVELAEFAVLWLEDGSEGAFSFEREWADNEGHTGKQARISTSKTTQSLPPLYESASSSGLCVCT
jgi:hypothetical protein